MYKFFIYLKWISYAWWRYITVIVILEAQGTERYDRHILKQEFHREKNGCQGLAEVESTCFCRPKKKGSGDSSFSSESVNPCEENHAKIDDFIANNRSKWSDCDDMGNASILVPISFKILYSSLNKNKIYIDHFDTCIWESPQNSIGETEEKRYRGSLM
jgi:hypothetical protein